VIALLVLGPQRLPGMARSIGRGVRELRNAIRNAGQELGVEDLEKDLRDLNDLRRPGSRLNVAKELGLDELGLDEFNDELHADLNAEDAKKPSTAETAAHDAGATGEKS
jgi:sec-independent protein translocase protein TatB